jgi:hypothetical protein
MDRDGDGIDEELTALIRAAIAFAARMAEEIARERERQARQAEAASEKRRAEYQARADAERAAARAQVQPVLRDEWWKKATPERIGLAYEAASAWAQYDDVARQAADRIRDEVKQRYDVDVDDLARDALIVGTPQEVAAGKDIADLTPAERWQSYLEAQRWLSSTDADLSERIGLKVRGADLAADSVAPQNEAIEAHRRHLAELEDGAAERHRSNEELAEATQLAALADQVDEHAAERDQAVHARADQILQEAAGVYDSAERRDQLVASFDGVADDEEVQARLIDDVGNALPPSAAVTRSRHPKARRSRGASTPSRDLEQGR